jgi:acetyl-CoA C-acetyltransferase
VTKALDDNNKNQAKKSQLMKDVYILSGARTPMGAFQGSLSSLTAVDLGSTAIAAALSRAELKGDAIDEVIMGCVLPGGLKQGPARQAAMSAGIPVETGATTINKLCGSGMKATMLAHDLIKAGTNDIMIAGGMESMTNAPYLLAKARGGFRMGHGEIQDCMFTDGLEDARTGRLMGSFAQDMADRYQMSREDMDNFKTRTGEITISDDEQPGKANIDKIPTLRPAFSADGTVTAANSSSISDGASALVMASGEAVAARRLTPMAKIVGHSTNSRDPSEFTIAPIGAVEKLLARIGWKADEVDLFEINEAFAMVTMAAIRDLGLDPAKVNIYGGACAQGHPIGSTGSRLIVTLMHALRQRGLKRGIAALCIGGGEATAVAIEMV